MAAYGITVEGSGGLLCDVPDLPGHVRPDRGQPGCDHGDRGGQYFPEAPEGRALAGRDR